ncbi:MAG: RNA-dependent DNA polymerase [Acidobacteria bacterium]|nr:RNA-dependent DNA polymerase [Acidobacteriota bacterium]
MKRVGNLWPSLISFENILGAGLDAARGKRTRPDVAAYLANLEIETAELQRELEDGTYLPGPYHTFRVLDPKPRMISAAVFRDRVVHHALTRILEPVFERRFSPDSYACRASTPEAQRGTHAALARARLAMRKYPYLLKCDIRKYFPSIDHEILKAELARAVKCGPTLDLAGRIIDGSNAQEPRDIYFPGDDLFTPFERRRGLPLGNPTSQFFANVYLDPLDQFVNRTLRAPEYVRYVDDFVLFGGSRAQLEEMLAALIPLLDELRLRPHSGKCQVRRTQDGLTFLGWRLAPGRMRLARANVLGFRSRMRTWVHEYGRGTVAGAKIRERIRAWIGHAEHGQTFRLREQLFDSYAFVRGTAV